MKKEKRFPVMILDAANAQLNRLCSGLDASKTKVLSALLMIADEKAIAEELKRAEDRQERATTLLEKLEGLPEPEREAMLSRLGMSSSSEA